MYGEGSKQSASVLQAYKRKVKKPAVLITKLTGFVVYDLLEKKIASVPGPECEPTADPIVCMIISFG